jgi:hypothetical protein
MPRIYRIVRNKRKRHNSRGEDGSIQIQEPPHGCAISSNLASWMDASLATHGHPKDARSLFRGVPSPTRSYCNGSSINDSDLLSVNLGTARLTESMEPFINVSSVRTSTRDSRFSDKSRNTISGVDGVTRHRGSPLRGKRTPSSVMRL